MPFITVFTSTNNRAFCLHKCFDSLCRQTDKDFVWIVVDDGSTDNTAELVQQWQSQNNGFEIEYYYKENGGFYSGYTTAFKHIRTELCVCIDSDDYMTDHAIELIHKLWYEKGGNHVAGIVGLDCLEDGSILGDPFPKQETINLLDVFLGKYTIKEADRKYIVRTELYKEAAPFDSIPGEKDFNPQYLHYVISKKFDFLVLNEKICVVEYLSDGMTSSVFLHYYRSPKSYRIMRQLDLSLPGTPVFLIKKTIHYISSCILSGEPCLSGTPHKLLAVMCYPMGIVFTQYVKYRAKKLNK